MDRGQRTVVAGIHRLQHIECFRTTTFPNDDPIGSHSERVSNKIPNRVFTGAFNVGFFGFQFDDVLFIELQFRRILDGDNAFLIRNEITQTIQQRRFSGSRSA